MLSINHSPLEPKLFLQLLPEAEVAFGASFRTRKANNADIQKMNLNTGLRLYGVANLLLLTTFLAPILLRCFGTPFKLFYQEAYCSQDLALCNV